MDAFLWHLYSKVDAFLLHLFASALHFHGNIIAPALHFGGINAKVTQSSRLSHRSVARDQQSVKTSINHHCQEGN